MNMELLDLYSDYLICQNKYSTATGLSALLPQISHDKVSRFLREKDLSSKDLWNYIKQYIRQIETEKSGILILDDTIEEKPYTDQNEIVAWHYSHSKGININGINILSCLVRYGDDVFPIGYEVVHKDTEVIDEKTNKIKRIASISKNEYFRNLLTTAAKNQVKFGWILADNWFSSKDNFDFIHKKLKKKFIIGIKSNRLVALSQNDKKTGKFQRVDELELKDGESKILWLKGNSFPMRLTKKILTNEDGSTGILFIVSNDLTDGVDHSEIYHKRWQIEVYHKSLKQNASPKNHLAKSPTKTVKTQKNHIFASVVGFCKLELLKLKTATNHFAIKYKLILAANQAALKELNLMKNTSQIQNFA